MGSCHVGSGSCDVGSCPCHVVSDPGHVVSDPWHVMSDPWHIVSCPCHAGFLFLLLVVSLILYGVPVMLWCGFPVMFQVILLML